MIMMRLSGQYIGKIDGGSPAEAAGLHEGDRIVEVLEIFLFLFFLGEKNANISR